MTYFIGNTLLVRFCFSLGLVLLHTWEAHSTVILKRTPGIEQTHAELTQTLLPWSLRNTTIRC